MAEDNFREGDKITLTKGANGWRVEMKVSEGGFIAPASADMFPDPETALGRLLEMAVNLKRRQPK